MNNLPMTLSLALLRDATIHYKLIAASIHRLSTHLMCQRSNIAHFSYAFVPLARLLSAARGALFQRLLGRGRVIPISIKPRELSAQSRAFGQHVLDDIIEACLLLALTNTLLLCWACRAAKRMT